ncbi:MAG TPA: TolC family protein [Terracidiphilus sp.]|nr:TolC family protein [Terracidiphilus sp.]
MRIERGAEQTLPKSFAVDAAKTYSLAELIDMAEAHNPETREAWEAARSQADALGVARGELYPTLVAAALSQTNRYQVYLNTRFYRQTEQSFGLALELNYTVFDFGVRAGQIDAAKAQLLAADFAFNDVHRQLIYRVADAYYQLLNAAGQVDAARASLANAQTVQQAAEARLKNGLATLPDSLEARSAAAQADYDLQAALGAQDIAHGNLATALGVSPTEIIHFESIEQLKLPDSIEDTVDQAIDRAFRQRPDLMRQIAQIRAANARLKQAHAAYLPTLTLQAQPDAESLYSLQQQLPWGNTAALDGSVSLGLHWTVFDGGARKNQLAQAQADIRTAQAQADLIRDQIENEIWAAYSDLKTAFRQRQAATKLLQAADQSYNAAIESYHYGVRNLLDVTQAQKTLAQARSADILARAQVLTALARLAFQTGDAIQPVQPAPQTRPQP